MAHSGQKTGTNASTAIATSRTSTVTPVGHSARSRETHESKVADLIAVQADQAEIAARLAAAVVFATGSLTKLTGWSGWRLRLGSYSLPVLRIPIVAIGIPLSEAAIATSLVVAPGWLAPLAGAAFLAGAAGVLLIAYARGGRGDCGCFGAVPLGMIGPHAALRALAMSAALLLLAVAPRSHVREPFTYREDLLGVWAVSAIIGAALSLAALRRLREARASRSRRFEGLAL